MSIFEYNAEEEWEKLKKAQGEYEREVGRAEGKVEGEYVICIDIVKRQLAKGATVETIADIIDQEIAYVLEIQTLLSEHPTESTLQLAQRILEKKKSQQ